MARRGPKYLRAVHWFETLLGSPVVQWIALLGLCAAYLQGGYDKISDFKGAVAELRQFGVSPAAPFAVATIATELLGSVLVLSGYGRWLGALWLAGFTLIATFLANRFWSAPAGERFMLENGFFEHLGLVGGFLLVAWLDVRGMGRNAALQDG